MKLPLRRAAWHNCTIEDANGQRIGVVTSPAEADEFIKRVNAHEELIGEYQDLINFCNDGGFDMTYEQEVLEKLK